MKIGKFTVTKQIDWCMAHRLTHGYPYKCRSLHGHNYTLFVELESNTLDKYGMVVDFGDIKKLIHKWLMDNWDHAVLVDPTDVTLIDFLTRENQRYYIIEENCNSTAEYMSKFLFHKTRELLEQAGIEAQVVSVRVYETATSYATYREV